MRKASQVGSEPATASQALGTGFGFYLRNSGKLLKGFKQGSNMACSWLDVGRPGHDCRSGEKRRVVSEEAMEIRKSLGGQMNRTY